MFGVEFQIFNQFDSENFKTLSFVLIFRKHSEPKTEYDLERDALKNAFAENTFDKLQNKKFGGSKYQDGTEAEVELEMENMVRSKTQKLWNITLQVRILHKVLKKTSSLTNLIQICSFSVLCQSKIKHMLKISVF